MIAPWPPKPRYNTKKLREAVNARAQAGALAGFIAAAYKSSREAIERLQIMRDAIEKALADIDSLHASHTADVSNAHLTNIRDELAAILDESDRP